MAPCFNNLRLVSTFMLTQRKRNVFVVRINTALWGQLSVNKPWCWQGDGGQEWTIRASAGDLQGYITRRGALGCSASKWGLGVFHSILGNDLHYEASEHFTRVPERVVVVRGTVLQLSQNET